MKTKIFCWLIGFSILAVAGIARATQCNVYFNDPVAIANSTPSINACARDTDADNGVYSTACGNTNIDFVTGGPYSHFHLGFKAAGFYCTQPGGGFPSSTCNLAPPVPDDGQGFGWWKWSGSGYCPGGTSSPPCNVPDWCQEPRYVVPHHYDGSFYIYRDDFGEFYLQEMRIGQFSWYFIGNPPSSSDDVLLYWWDIQNGVYQAVALKSPPRKNGFYRFPNFLTDFVVLVDNGPNQVDFEIDDFQITTL